MSIQKISGLLAFAKKAWWYGGMDRTVGVVAFFPKCATLVCETYGSVRCVPDKFNRVRQHSVAAERRTG